MRLRALQISPEGRLLRGGQSHAILSGAIHYFRVHPDQWLDRLERVRALGLNTIDTYVAWNFHQPTRNTRPDWAGWRDVERFVRLAGELGLDVIVRPGPYICAEWSGGGLPTFVTDASGVVLRTSDPVYQSFVAEWFSELLPRLAPLQFVHGGPVVAVQIENEYGSYGDDRAHLEWLRKQLVDNGIEELLFTADGSLDRMQEAGSLPGVWATSTYGSGAVAARKLSRRRRPQEPFLGSEVWCGWFDHWGEKHHTRSPESAAQTVAETVADQGSINIYMAHGGTNFGLWAGANHDGTRLQPTVTSYDYDAPVAEDGRLTQTGHAIREVLARAQGLSVAQLPAVPSLPATLQPQQSPVRHGAGLPAVLRAIGRSLVSTPGIPAFADLDLPGGLLWATASTYLPDGEVEMVLHDLHDRAYVRIDGKLIARVDDGPPQPIVLVGAGRRVEIDLLVEDRGRINYGPLLGAGKGVLGGVTVANRYVHEWSATAVPLTDVRPSTFAGLADEPGDVGIAIADFDVADPGDTHLALPGFARGFVWVNDFLLGRYDEVGPQVTHYLPAPLLHRGSNRVTVLELERRGTHLQLRDCPDLGSTEEYIEILHPAPGAVARRTTT